MPKTNLQFFLNAYSDICQTTTPFLNNFKWTREINGIPHTLGGSPPIQVPAGVTSPNIVPYAFSTPTNTETAVLNSTTVLALSGNPSGIAVNNLVVGANIPVGTTVSVFNPYTVFTVTSANATAGATYTNNGHTFTVTTTIVAGTTLITTQTGLPLTSGTLTLASGTGDATITFSAYTGPSVTMSMASTTSTTETVNFYQPSSFIYLESDQQVLVIYNGGTAMALNPFQINGFTTPGVFFMNGPCYSLTITNPGTVAANIFFASMG